MKVIVNAHGLQNGDNGIPSWLQRRGEGGVGASAVSYCNGGAATAVTLQAPKGDPEIAAEWTTAQHAILEELLKKYESDPPVIRYAKLGLQIPEKKITDVAFRCKWTTKKETRKRRKNDSLPRKSKNKKISSSSIASNPRGRGEPKTKLNGDKAAIQKPHKHYKKGAIGGPTGLLLGHTAELFNQITGNLTKFQINDNISLFFQARDNILEVMNELHDDIPPEMKLMPPLPVKLKELANTILPCISPRSPLLRQT